jgi:hypothetical protein
MIDAIVSRGKMIAARLYLNWESLNRGSPLERVISMSTATAPCRKVCYGSFDEVVSDAQRAVRDKAGTTGNWSLGQILQHLALANEKTIDGFGFQAPFPVRMIGPLFKKRLLERGLTPGFQLSKKGSQALVPGETDADAALERLRHSFQRLQAETKRSPHPFLGRMSIDESNRLCLRHAELHLSFVKAS